MHEVLVNRLGGLSLPWKSVVRLTYRPDMTLDVYRGRKTTIQQLKLNCLWKVVVILFLVFYKLIFQVNKPVSNISPLKEVCTSSFSRYLDVLSFILHFLISISLSISVFL